MWGITSYCKLKKDLTLSNGKILDQPKLKTFADEKIKLAEMSISVFDRK